MCNCYLDWQYIGDNSIWDQQTPHHVCVVCHLLSEAKLGDEDERKKFRIEWIGKVQLSLYIEVTKQLNDTKWNKKNLKQAF